MGDYKQAEASIQKSLELQPNNPDAWRRYLLLAEKKLDWSESGIRDLYVVAETAVRDKTDIYTSFAGYLEKIGDIEGAIEQWERAREVYPENKEVYEAEIARLKK